MIKTIQPRSKEKIGHVLYELEMLNHAFPIGYHYDDTYDRRRRVESFLIHARNLIYFLRCDGRKSDLFCRDFKDANSQLPLKPILVNLSQDVTDLIHRHCLHITKERLKRKPVWKMDSINLIKREINKAMLDFGERIGEKRRLAKRMKN